MNEPQNGLREIPLTSAQVAALGDWLADTTRIVVIGSIGPRAYEPGMAAERIGEVVATVGRIPRDRLEAVRQAACGELKSRRPKRMTAPAKS